MDSNSRIKGSFSNSSSTNKWIHNSSSRCINNSSICNSSKQCNNSNTKSKWPWLNNSSNSKWWDKCSKCRLQVQLQHLFQLKEDLEIMLKLKSLSQEEKWQTPSSNSQILTNLMLLQKKVAKVVRKRRREMLHKHQLKLKKKLIIQLHGKESHQVSLFYNQLKEKSQKKLIQQILKTWNSMMINGLLFLNIIQNTEEHQSKWLPGYMDKVSKQNKCMQNLLMEV